MGDGKHEAGVEPATITFLDADGNPVPAPTVWNQAKHYAKALIGAVIAGLTYFLTVLAPSATVGDITLVQWIGFWVITLGTLIGVAATPNGAKPAKK